MSPSAESRSHRHQAAVLLLLALTLRLLATQFARFTGDESDQWSKAVRIAQLEYFPALGQPITGSVAMTPGPAFQYIMAIPQILGSSVWLGTYFTVLLNVLAVWIFYLLARRFAGPKAGLVALALAACSPWAIVYSEKIWSANVLPLWGTLAFYAAVRSPESPRWQAVLILLAGALPQVHLSAPALWVGCIVWLVLTPGWRISPKWVLIGVGLTTLAYLPMLVYELTHGFSNLRAILEHSAGTESPAYARTLPLRVLGAAVGQGTSEIAYQLRRGYWEFGGGFDGYRMWTTRQGLTELWSLYGPLAAIGTLISILLAVLAWISSLRSILLGATRALRARRRDGLAEGERFTVSLLAALGTAIFLMAMSKKTFFPHYIAFLLPILLWPMVGPISRWLEFRRWGKLAIAALVLSCVSMVANAERYYRDVDSLDGLRNTLAILEDILSEKTPASIQFRHFNNLYSWERLAQYHFGKPLQLRDAGAVRYVVENREAHPGPTPTDATLYGGRLLVRRDARAATSDPAELVFRGALDWSRFQVSKIDAAGGVTPCTPLAGGLGCSYGPNSWERFGPEVLSFGGRAQSVLFLHPSTGHTLRAELLLPSEARRGRLYVGLTDGAMASANRSLVHVRVKNGDRVLLETDVGSKPGLHAFPVVVTSTSPLSLELTTANDGARVLGFDLDLAR